MVSIFKMYPKSRENQYKKKIINEPKSKWPIWQYDSNLELVFNRHWLYFYLVSSAASRTFSRAKQWRSRVVCASVVAWKIVPFFPWTSCHTIKIKRCAFSNWPWLRDLMRDWTDFIKRGTAVPQHVTENSWRPKNGGSIIFLELIW